MDQDRNSKMRLSTQAYLEAVKAMQSEADPFLHPKHLRRNVKGMGVGVKWVKGKPTGEPALIVFVTEKVNREQLTNPNWYHRHWAKCKPMWWLLARSGRMRCCRKGSSPCRRLQRR